ncbi:hypothetical protein Ocin01_13359 [Orchesella cincta]|uniref:Uncharacterized protein n=1 Tax=Orchesella cincta TaxID=48709 RepID=A0A1D2MKH3_ORCCI|nr:hypothetical protein Ocin01_13359 [Orchesella cincta]
MNPDPLAINAVKNPLTIITLNQNPVLDHPVKSKGACYPSKPRVSSSSSILINEDDEADEVTGDLVQIKTTIILSRVLDITSAACVRARIPMRPASKITFNTSTLAIDLR